MSEQYGILLVSHVAELADGLARLLKQVAKDVTVKAVGGVEDGGIGTSFDKGGLAVSGHCTKQNDCKRAQYRLPSFHADESGMGVKR